MKHVVLVSGRHSYRTADYVEAAAALRVTTTIATDGPTPLAGDVLAIDIADPAGAAAAIAAAVPHADAVIALDDQGVVVAGRAAQALGLRHNPADGLEATRDKLLMRRRLQTSAVSQPRFAAADPGEVPAAAAAIGFPAVVKPRGLSASQGVIRVDQPAQARDAEERIRAILRDAGYDDRQQLLVEEYVDGEELSVDGLLVEGTLEVLAVIDKPAPLAGPFFEETLFTTPSRHSPAEVGAAVDLVESAVRAVGLVHGPIHAEVRIGPDRSPRLIEIAARTIGGLCGRALSFGLIGESLEALVLRGSLGLPTIETSPALPATGVLMLPIPATGHFTGVTGIDEARAVAGITDVTITAPQGTRVVPLPEGDRYLGFVFAAGATPASVEGALRKAASAMRVTIDGEDVLAVIEEQR